MPTEAKKIVVGLICVEEKLIREKKEVIRDKTEQLTKTQSHRGERVCM